MQPDFHFKYKHIEYNSYYCQRHTITLNVMHESLKEYASFDYSNITTYFMIDREGDPKSENAGEQPYFTT